MVAIERAVTGGDVSALATSQGRLDELADVINAEHGHAALFAAKALQHAVGCGTALLEAKELCGRGYWLAWLRDNVEMSESSAHTYMRIAQYADRLQGQRITTIRHAQDWLHSQRLRLQIGPEQKALMVGLSGEGLSHQEIADRVGVAKSSVARHLSDPDAGTRPRPTDNLGWQHRTRKSGRRIGITDDMIEGAAGWLCKRFADAGYFAEVNDQVRHDATELLRISLGVTA